MKLPINRLPKLPISRETQEIFRIFFAIFVIAVGMFFAAFTIGPLGLVVGIFLIVFVAAFWPRKDAR